MTRSTLSWVLLPLVVAFHPTFSLSRRGSLSGGALSLEAQRLPSMDGGDPLKEEEDLPIVNFDDADDDDWTPQGDEGDEGASLSSMDDMDLDALMAKLQRQGVGDYSPAKKIDEGKGNGYEWVQKGLAMTVTIAGVTVPSNQIDVAYPTAHSIVVKAGEKILVRGDLAGGVVRDECFWSLEDETIVIELTKDLSKPWKGLLDNEGDASKAKVTQRCFLDVELMTTSPKEEGENVTSTTPLGRVEVGLFGDDVPLTVDNFKALCDASDTRVPYTYAKTPFHRVIPGFMCQAGDVVNQDGSGGVSIYGDTFPDERFAFKFDHKGLLAMANAGVDTNKSQFFITTGTCPWLDERHVIFGRVLSGYEEVVEQIEAKTGSTSGKVEGNQIAYIKNCGLL